MKQVYFIGLMILTMSLPLLADDAKDVKKETPKATAPAAPAPAPKTDQPAPAPADNAMTATVISVKGLATKMDCTTDNPKWVPVKAGDILNEKTFIRTGLGGAEVVIRFGECGQTVIKGCTKIGIGEFRKENEKVKTRLGLKYGSVRANIDSTRHQNDYKVQTPVATLSVRGTAGYVGHSGDAGTGITSTHNTWNTTTNTGQGGNVGQGQSGGSGPAGQFASNRYIGQHNRDTQMGDPNGSTGNEQNNLINNGGGRGIFGFAGGGTFGTNLFSLYCPGSISNSGSSIHSTGESFIGYNIISTGGG